MSSDARSDALDSSASVTTPSAARSTSSSLSSVIFAGLPQFSSSKSSPASSATRLACVGEAIGQSNVLAVKRTLKGKRG